MAPADEPRLITPISRRQFELYALSLERGPNLDPAQIFSAYQAGRGSASGCILLDPEQGMTGSPPYSLTGEAIGMTSEPSDRTIILNLFRGAVPERADEISSLWSQYGHAVEVAPSTKGVTMNADATRIQFDTKTIDFFWLFGFSAWRAIEVYSPALVLATITGMPLDQALNVDTERGPFELDYKQRIASAQSLISADQSAEIFWPADIPEPTSDRESLGDVQHMAAFDLAFSLLHEFKHVMYYADSSAPSALPEEEIACDTYARDFMTSGLAAYAKKHGHNFAEVQQKRAMGIALAAVIIHAMTPTHAH